MLTELRKPRTLGINIMKLTTEQVKAMHQEFREGRGPAELSTKYGVSRQTVYHILQGKKGRYRALGLGDGFAPQSPIEEVLEAHQSKAVKAVRELWGITQEELARVLGKSSTTISNWETDNTQMSITDRRMLAGWLTDQGVVVEQINQRLALAGALKAS